nr:hypothetical protein [Tanacetum cinerariifolium]
MRLKEIASWVKGHRYMVLLGEGYGTVLVPPAAATWQHPIGLPPVTWHLGQHDHRCRSTTVNTAGQRRSTPPATGQRRRITVVIGGQRWRSTTVAGGEPPLTAARPPLTTTRPPVNGGWWAGQHLEMGRSGSGLGRVRIGSGPGPPRGMPRVSHVCTRVSHVCPRGIHVDADVDIKH